MREIGASLDPPAAFVKGICFAANGAVALAAKSAIENSPELGASEQGGLVVAEQTDSVDDSAVTLLAAEASKAVRRGPITRYRRADAVAGKYRLVRLLGSGGMGAVWVAHHLDLDMQVALKLIRADVDDDGMGQRFLSEARLLARIEHRAVVRILDFGRTEHGDPFIVMELLRGEDLRSAIERHVRMSPEMAVALLLPVAEGLVAAHARQIVHRDLKPDNIFLADVGRARQPKILDFGIARCLAAHSDIHVTGSGCVVGSPEYMAPEQAQGRSDIDHRADVWGFCSVLYECITGQRPFAYEGNYERLLRRIIEEPVISIEDFGIDEPELAAILSKGFEKDREDRWQSIDEFAMALAAWLLKTGEAEDASGTSLRAAWFRRSAKGDEVPIVTAYDIRTKSGLPLLRWRGKSSLAGLGALAVMGVVLFSLRGPRAEAHDAGPPARGAAPAQPAAAAIPAPTPAVRVEAASAAGTPSVTEQRDLKKAPPPPSADVKKENRRVKGTHRPTSAAAGAPSVAAPPRTAASAASAGEIETRDSVELFYENLGF